MLQPILRDETNRKLLDDPSPKSGYRYDLLADNTVNAFRAMATHIYDQLARSGISYCEYRSLLMSRHNEASHHHHYEQRRRR